jgi:hypothetical protein
LWFSVENAKKIYYMESIYDLGHSREIYYVCSPFLYKFNRMIEMGRE